MIRAHDIVRTLVFSFIVTITACSPQGEDKQTPQIESAVGWEVQGQETLKAITTPPTSTEDSLPPTQTSLPSPTITFTPTITLTPTQPAPKIDVTENTHCRSGPGLSYDSLGVLLVGEVAEILAQSTVDDYWYITLPDKPERPCWLSDLYANVVGKTDALPALTPIPSPTPEVGFDLFLNSFQACGSTFFVVFSVQNTGANILKSGTVEIVEHETGNHLYGPTYQRFPFAQAVKPVCPPGHGNELFPGQIQYIHVPIDPVPHGKIARGWVKLCTGDHQSGECVTRTIYFDIQ